MQHFNLVMLRGGLRYVTAGCIWGLIYKFIRILEGHCSVRGCVMLRYVAFDVAFVICMLRLLFACCVYYLHVAFIKVNVALCCVERNIGIVGCCV